MTWKKDIVYVGTKEIAEVSPTGASVTLCDHLGSPRFIWNGTTITQQKFLPFGESLTPPSDMAKVSKGFTNHEQTDASGMIYMQARFYLPMWGRFASTDPALDQHFEDTQTWNIYSYVCNNPTMNLDPDGQVKVPGWLKDLGSAAKDLAVNNPISQAYLQLSDNLNAAFCPGTPMWSNLGKAAERGAGGLEMTVEALKGPAEVAAGAVTGVVVGKVVGAVEGAVAKKAIDGVVKSEVAPQTLLSRQSSSEMTGSQVKRLAKDMKANGFDATKPIQVANADGKSVILDGHHRTAAAIKAGIKKVPIETRTVTKVEADKLLNQVAESRR